MPKVYRKRPKKQFERKYWDGPNSTIEERKKVAWSDLSRSETTKAIAKRLTALTLASGLVVAVLPNGPVDLLGDGPSAAKRSDQVRAVNREADSLFSGLTINQKYALTYLTPAELSESGNSGGNGLLGVFLDSGGHDLKVNVGQNCLKSTAFDTGASYVDGRFVYGTLSAVASLSVNGSEVQVHPAGSNAPPLNFGIDAAGLLQADAPTTQTLNAYGCEAGLQLYEKKGWAYEKLSTDNR